MNISDFLLSVLSSVVGNALTPASKKFEPERDKIKEIKSETDLPRKTTNKLKVRAIIDDSSWANIGVRFQNLLTSIERPNVYFFIEFENSTYYNLVTVIVEDSRTHDWYPFGQKISFQGSGGGQAASKEVNYYMEQARKADANVSVSIRVANNDDLIGILNGDITWHQLKERSIPALISEDVHFQTLQNNFQKMVLDRKDSPTSKE